MPRWAHLRSRLFPYVEPFQADGGARPPRARGEGGVERGPTPRPSPLVARRPAAAACWPRRGLEPRRAIWAQGLRGGAAGTPLARGSAWTSRWGGRAGARGVASTTPPRSLRGQSCRALFPFHPSPPASSSAAAPAHLAAGRGAPRLRDPGRLSRMLRGLEPCSCHGRSSLCCCPPLHQALKPGRPHPPVPPTAAFGFSFQRVLSLLRRLSL